MLLNFSLIIYLMPWIIVALVALFIFKRRRTPGHTKGEVKHCIYCGATIGADGKFCGKCNKKQPTYGHLPPTY